jgi:hypothetical protein
MSMCVLRWSEADLSTSKVGHSLILPPCKPLTRISLQLEPTEGGDIRLENERRDRHARRSHLVPLTHPRSYRAWTTILDSTLISPQSRPVSPEAQALAPPSHRRPTPLVRAALKACRLTWRPSRLPLASRTTGNLNCLEA